MKTLLTQVPLPLVCVLPPSSTSLTRIDDSLRMCLEIRFKEHGVEAFEVQDNGKGIDQTDWDGIGLLHQLASVASS